MTEEQLKEIEERAEKATPGPWESDEDCPLVYLSGDGGLITDCHAPLSTEEGRAQAAADARFIANTRADVPALLAEVRKLRAVLAELVDLKEIHDKHDPTWDEHSDPDSYVDRKPRAWAAAREALGRAE